MCASRWPSGIRNSPPPFRNPPTQGFRPDSGAIPARGRRSSKRLMSRGSNPRRSPQYPRIAPLSRHPPQPWGRSWGAMLRFQVVNGMRDPRLLPRLGLLFAVAVAAGLVLILLRI